MPFLDNYIPVPGSQAAGGLVEMIDGDSFDPYMYRPFFDKYGRPAVLANTGRFTVEKGVRVPIRQSTPVRDLLNRGYINPVLLTANTTALQKEQYIMLDSVVLREARAPMRAYADLATANTFGGFDGMSVLTLEYEAMSDPGFALMDMDAMTEGRADTPLFKLRSMPLPITHSDFWFSERRLRVSRRGSTPLDTTMAEAGARRIGETIERVTIGTQAGIRFGDVTTGPTAHDTSSSMTSTVYGYLTFPHRLTKTDITIPTDVNWHPNLLVSEFLAAREQLYQNNFFGPFMVYHSTDWDQYLDNDYFFHQSGGSAANLTPSRTLRDRLRALGNVSDVRRLDFLTPTATHWSNAANPFTFIFVQMTSDVARAVNGMGIITVQWPSIGGMRQNFKIMTIQAPQLRSDYRGQTGILEATTS